MLLVGQATAVEQVTLSRDGREMHVAGKLLVEAQDGGLLVLAPDGVLWAVEPEDLVKRAADDRPFVPLKGDELARELLADLPDGFSVHTTAHYVICYNTSREYAQWCGALYERLYKAFVNFWDRRGFELHEPELPLAAIVFADRAGYEKYAAAELGDAASSIVAYYSLRTNRMTMYDLTGVEALRAPANRRGSLADINRMLSQPQAEPMVATVVHEATHQIAFNCGLQTRYADIPLWVSEGIAVYFETPDLKSSKGWRGVGAVNGSRLRAFRAGLRTRGGGAIAGLISDDRRMRDPRQSPAAYADAWALTYHLIRRRPDDYIAYLQMLSKKDRLVWDDPETRLAEFQRYFGDDLDSLDAELVENMMRLR